MTERDPLRAHFDAFRDESISTANPPSVEEIPRRLRGGRRRRVAAVVLAAAVLIALTILPSWRHGTPTPTPATSTTPAPSSSASARPPAGPSVGPSVGARSSGHSSVSPLNATSGGTCTTTARGLPLLPNGRTEALLSYNDSQTMVPSPANLFDICPAARLPFVHVTYGWDIERKQYVLLYNASYTLIKTQPTLPRPAMRGVPNNACGQIETLLATSRAVPSTIPRSVQDSTDSLNAVLTYLQKNALALPYVISIDSYDTVMSHSYCMPSPAPT